jgi:hypothetical protein
MVTSPLSAEQIRSAADPANYWDMAPGGPLHPEQTLFLMGVEQDPAAFGFEGNQEELNRLRVAAVYLHEEESAAISKATREALPAGQKPGTYSLEAQKAAPTETRLIQATETTLQTHSDIAPVVAAIRRYNRRLQQGFETSDIQSITSWLAYDVPYIDDSSAARRAARPIITAYEQQLYQPVVTRLRNRAAAIPADQVQWEVDNNTFDRHEILKLQQGLDYYDPGVTMLRAAQRSFRIANATEMSIEELTKAMDFESGMGAGALISELVSMGALQRNAAGDRVTATDMLRVPQSRMARAASMLGYRVLHHTGMLRLPQLEKA